MNPKMFSRFVPQARALQLPSRIVMSGAGRNSIRTSWRGICLLSLFFTSISLFVCPPLQAAPPDKVIVDKKIGVQFQVPQGWEKSKKKVFDNALLTLMSADGSVAICVFREPVSQDPQEYLLLNESRWSRFNAYRKLSLEEEATLLRELAAAVESAAPSRAQLLLLAIFLPRDPGR